MPGLFDDVLAPSPKSKSAAAAGSGLFDDVLPAAGPSRNDEDEVADLIGVPRRKRSESGDLSDMLLRGLMGIPELAGNALELPVNVADAAVRAFGGEPGRVLGGVRRGVEYVADAAREPAAEMDAIGMGRGSVSGSQLVEALNPNANANRADAAEGFGSPGNYTPLTALDRINSVGRFALETGVRAGPEMLAAVGALPLYIAGRTNAIAESRAENDGRSDPSLADIGIAAPAATFEALLERFTTARLLPQGTTLATPGVKEAITRIAKEVGIQAPAGGLEELAPYLAETLGTEKGATGSGALESVVGGIVGEGALGGAASAAKELAGAVSPELTPEQQRNKLLGDLLAQTLNPEAVGDVAATMRPDSALPVEAMAEVLRQAAPQPAPAQAAPDPIIEALQAAVIQPEVSDGSAPPRPIMETGRGAGVPADGPDIRQDAAAGSAREAPGSEPAMGASPDARADAAVGAQAEGVTRDNPLPTEREGDAPVGAWVAGPRIPGVAPADTVRQVMEVPIEQIDATEFDSAGNIVPEKRAGAERYAEDMRNGAVMPNARGSELPNGKIKLQDGHRRLAAAKANGATTLRIAVSPMPAPTPTTTTLPAGSAFDQRPEPKAADPLDMRPLIGWSQEGGRMLRAPYPQEMMNEDERAGKVGEAQMPKGEVIGRTTWVGLAGPDGQPSSFWRNRPDPRHFTEVEARAAMDKYERGEPLKPKEQRFIDYARDAAAEYAEIELAMQEEMRDIEAAQTVEERQRDLEEIADALAAAEADPRIGNESYEAWAERLMLPLEPTREDDARAEESRTGEAVEAEVPASESSGSVAEAEAGGSGEVTEPRTTSMRNEVKDAERAARGAEPLESRKGPGNQEAVDNARAALDENPDAVKEAIERVMLGDTLKVGDQAILIADNVRLQALADELEVGTPEWDEVQRDLHAGEVALRGAGSIAGSELQLRQAEIAEDYTVTGMARHRREAIDGGLTAADAADVKAWAERIATAEAAAAKAVADLAAMKERPPAKRDPKNRPLKSWINERADAARAALAAMESVPVKRGQSGAVMNPVALVYLTEIGASHVVNGAYKFVDWNAQMRADLGDRYSEFKEDMRDVFRAAKAFARGRDEEVDYQARRGQQLDRAKAEIERKIAEGDYESARKRAVRSLNSDNASKQFEFNKLKQQWALKNFELEMERQSKGDKRRRLAGDVMDMSRATMASSDYLPILRQGGHLLMSGHWGMLRSAIAAGTKAMVSQEAEFAELQKIWDRPGSEKYDRNWTVGKKKVRLAVSDAQGGIKLSRMEEAFAARLLYKLPNNWKTGLMGAAIGMYMGGPVGAVMGGVAGLRGGSIVRASARGFTVFLSRTRADYQDWMLQVAADENPTPLQGYAATNFVNVMTGRGGLGSAESAALILARSFFAPRFWKSQLDTISLQPYRVAIEDKRMSRLIARQYAREIAGYTLVFGLVALWAANRDKSEDSEEEKENDKKPIISFDIRSTYFGQIRVGRTYINILRGLSSPMVLVARGITGESVAASGKVYATRDSLRWNDLKKLMKEKAPDFFADLEIEKYGNRVSKKGKKKGEQLGFKDDTFFSSFVRYVRGKLAPIPAATATFMSNMTDLIGKKKTFGELLVGLYTPMSPRDMYKIAHEEYGIPAKAIILTMVTSGAGASVHEEDKDKEGNPDKPTNTDPRL